MEVYDLIRIPCCFNFVICEAKNKHLHAITPLATAICVSPKLPPPILTPTPPYTHPHKCYTNRVFALRTEGLSSNNRIGSELKIDKTEAKYKDWSGVEFAKYPFQFGKSRLPAHKVA